jgi:hypothetical protein
MEISELRNNLKTQDNRSTAKPIFFLLQEKRTYVCHEEYDSGYEEDIWVERLSGDYCRFKSQADVISWLKENYPEHTGQVQGIHWDTFKMGCYWNTVNVFFTEEGYKQHLLLNEHNLGEHRLYVIHAFRNPEIELVQKVILGE